MRACRPIRLIAFSVLFSLLGVCLMDAAQAVDRWPPWQNYGEAERAQREKLKRHAPPKQSQIDELNRQVSDLRKAGKYAEAIPVAQAALRLTEQRYGPNHAVTAAALTTLAELMIAQNRLADAEPLLKRALAIHEKAKTPDPREIALAAYRLAKLYEKQGRHADAKPVMERAIEMRNRQLALDPTKPMPKFELSRPPAAANGDRKAAEEKASRGAPGEDKSDLCKSMPSMCREEEPPGIAAEKSAKPKARAYYRKAAPPAASRDGGEPAAMPTAPETIEPAAGAEETAASPPAASAPPATAVRRSAEPPDGGTGMARGPAAPESAPPSDVLSRKSGGGGAPPAAAPAAAPPPPPPPTMAREMAPESAAETEEQKDWDVVPVFYGTDREVEPNAKRLAYGSDRGRRLDLGRALVTVPKAHEVPQVERPWAIRIPYFNVTIYEEAEDPKKHFTMQEIKKLSREDFLRLVQERLGGSDRFKDQALVFVHGYNTSFDNAVYRTAQIAYDLKFDGAPFLYSWPSGGAVASYTYDRESAEASKPYMRKFLEMVVKETGAKAVSIIAHSMGNQPLLDVLKDMKSSTPEGVVISQVILAAPDVDADSFSDLAQAINGLAKGVTLYAAANDRALIVSRNFWGNYRAGDVPSTGPLVLPGIDTIDVTAASTDAFAINHSGYAQNNQLLKDIAELIETGKRPPEDRAMKPKRVTTDHGSYWRYILPASSP